MKKFTRLLLFCFLASYLLLLIYPPRLESDDKALVEKVILLR